MQDEKKKFIVMGQTGAGKSYFLNLLEGKEGDSGSFAVADDVQSCTKEIKIQTIKLYGTSQEVILVDTPGFYDTSEKNIQKKKEKPYTLQMLENLSEKIEKQFDNKINRIFLCIAAQDKIDTQKKNIFEMVNMFVASSIRITVIVTKINTILNKQQSKFKEQWISAIRQEGFEDIIFLSDVLKDEEKQQLSVLVEKSLPEKIYSYNQLTKIQKQRICEILNYEGCFPLNTKITDENGNQIQILDYIKNLQNYKIKIKSFKQSSNYMLGYIEFNLNDPLNFISFDLQDQTTNEIQNLEISLKHMVYIIDQQGFIPACDVKIGNLMQGLNNTVLKVVKIGYTKHYGFCSPLTSEGCFYANSVLVSSYTKQISYCTQERAHLTFQPLIFYRSITMKQLNQEKEERQDQLKINPIILPTYVKFLKLFAEQDSNI